MTFLNIKRLRRRPWILLLSITAIVIAGCSRAYYRQQADQDAYCLIQEKTCNPDWPLDGYSIEVDSMSRMYDPFCPDHPPMPPDDPAAHQYMHCVDGKKGWPCWHANGDTDLVEGPNWLETLPRCDNGNVLIDESLAVQLAFLHSPEYQVELEDLYLSALDVSFERFRFDTQFFGGTGLTFTADGRDRNGTGESSSLLDLSSRNIQAQRLFATGGQLVVGLANSLLWQFAGPNTNAANTLIDFSFVQPLLRMGGRDFVLERLTIAERALLANVRQMERFRRGFYLQVVTGRDAGRGPSRRGGVFGGSGLEGFTGVGGGGFGQLTGGGLGGFAGGAGAGQAGGFLGLLQAQQDLRNQQANIAALESSVAQLDAFFRAGRIDFFQVELARQALFNAQSRLLNSQLAFAADKDNFKIQLGISPDIKIELDDELIEPFQLVDANSVRLQNELTLLQRKLGQAIIAIIQAAAEGQEGDAASQSESKPAADLPEPSDESSNGRTDDTGVPIDETDSGDDSDAPEGKDDRPESKIFEPLDAGRELGRPLNGVYAASYLEEALDEITKELSPESAEESERKATARSSAGVLPKRKVEWGPQIRRKLLEVKQLIGQAQTLCEQSTQRGLPRAVEDIDRLASSLDERKSSMERLKALLKRRLEEQADTCDDEPAPAVDVDSIIPFDPSRLSKLPEQLEGTIEDLRGRFGALREELAEFDATIDELIEKADSISAEELYDALTKKVFAPAPNALNELSANILSLILVQVRARTQNASLIPVELDWRDALETARCHRLDWMNARAALVDTWRLIQFNSDALQSDLNLIFSGDISNVGDNPFDLRDSTGRLRAGIEFDAPITRLSERNTYRQALIEYQQARRTYYQSVDQITNGLRGLLRGLEINQVNFELRRAAVEVAIAQVELARLRLQEPPKPDEPANLGATTARDLVSALSDLLNVQNDFLSVWINHESLRRSLDFDLGTMQLDALNMWIDPGPIAGSGNGTEMFDPTMQPTLDSEGRAFPDWGEEGIERIPEPTTDSAARPLKLGTSSEPEGAGGQILDTPRSAEPLPIPTTEKENTTVEKSYAATPIGVSNGDDSSIQPASSTKLEIFREIHDAGPAKRAGPEKSADPSR